MNKFLEDARAWLETREMKSDRLSAEELDTLKKAAIFERKIRSLAHLVWRAIIDLCAIIAAIFGVLAYFKQ